MQKPRLLGVGVFSFRGNPPQECGETGCSELEAGQGGAKEFFSLAPPLFFSRAMTSRRIRDAPLGAVWRVAFAEA